MSNAEITIRVASGEEIPLLADFACAMALETESKRLDHDTVVRGVTAVIEQPARGRYLVAERDGDVVGTLMLTYEWSDWRCADWWWIQSVYVSPSARRSGVFAALYQSLRDEIANRRDVCGLRLYVETENRSAQATYEGLGMLRSHYHQYEYAQPWLAEIVTSS